MSIVYQTDKRSGITYAYESKAYWDKEKQQSRSKRHLIGRLDKQTGKIVPTDGRNRRAQAKAGQKPTTTHRYFGATYLLAQLAQQIGLDQDLKACFGTDAEQIFGLAQYLALEPHNALYRFNHWQSNHAHAYQQAISSQKSSALFAKITGAQIEGFFRQQGKRRIEQEYWAYDSTSISSYSQGLKQVRYGRNKEHDPLAQLNLLLVFGEQSGLPFYYRKLSGSIPDVKTVTKLLEDLDVLGIQQAKLVMDRGFYSRENINQLMQQHRKFLLGVRTNLKYVKAAIAAHTDDLASFQNYDPNSGLYGITVRQDWTYEQSRPRKGDVLTQKRRVYLQLYRNNERQAEDEYLLDQRLSQCYQELQSNHLVTAHAKDYDRFFTVKETPKRGRQITPNDDAIHQAKQLCGYWALLTNEKMTATEALTIYRSKDLAEKGFGNYKERLNGRRLLVSSEASLDGKLFVQFVALILVSAINQVMIKQHLYQHYTMTQLLDRLDEIEQFTTAGRRPKVGEIQADQAAIYTAFDIPVPTSL